MSSPYVAMISSRTTDGTSSKLQYLMACAIQWMRDFSKSRHGTVKTNLSKCTFGKVSHTFDGPSNHMGVDSSPQNPSVLTVLKS